MKDKGRVKNLYNLPGIDDLEGTIGIAHTRWATHGKPSVENAHPHRVGNITLVHNGIIENAEELREKLKKENVVFEGETDTETLTALINKYYKNDPIEAISNALKEVKGSYALGILFENSNDLYAVRKDSPLIIGIGEKENFIASDIAAIIDYTNKYIFSIFILGTILMTASFNFLSFIVSIYFNGFTIFSFNENDDILLS